MRLASIQNDDLDVLDVRCRVRCTEAPLEFLERLASISEQVVVADGVEQRGVQAGDRTFVRVPGVLLEVKADIATE